MLEIETSVMLCIYNLLSLLCTSVTRQGNLYDFELEIEPSTTAVLKLSFKTVGVFYFVIKLA